MKVYILNENTTWQNQTLLTNYIIYKEITTNSTGGIPTTSLWESPSVGSYDIILDINSNTKYDQNVDYLYSSTTYGFQVLQAPAPTLTISIGPSSPTDHTWDKDTDTGDNLMLQIKLVAGSTEGVKVTGLGFIAAGTGDDSECIHFIKLINDPNYNGVMDSGESMVGYGQFSKDNGILTITMDYSLTTNQTAYLSIFYTMTTNCFGGETYSFTLADVTAQGTSTGAVAKVSGLSLESSTKTIGGTTTTTTSTTTTTTTTTTVPTTTTTTQPEEEGLKIEWWMIVLIIVVVAVPIVIALILKSRAQRTGYGYEFEKLKESYG